MDFLLKNSTCFKPEDCCRKFVNDSVRFSMIVEFTGNVALFKSVNTLLIINTDISEKYVKGATYQSFNCDNLAGKNFDDLKLML